MIEHVVLAEQFAVIGGEHHDRIVELPGSRERGQQLREEVVQLAQRSVVVTTLVRL